MVVLKTARASSLSSTMTTLGGHSSQVKFSQLPDHGKIAGRSRLLHVSQEARLRGLFFPCPVGTVGYNGWSRDVSVFVARGKGVRVGYFDCFSGIAGDMTLAALVDAGVDRRAIQEARGQPRAALRAHVRERCAGAGSGRPMPRSSRPRSTSTATGTTSRRSIDKSSLTPRQKDLAKRIFLKLGEAEAAVHGVDLAKIHFHEVGAVDSIVDIVGSAVGLDLLGVDRFEASPVPTGPRLGQGRARADAAAGAGDGRAAARRSAGRIDDRGRDDHARPAPRSSRRSSSGSRRCRP